MAGFAGRGRDGLLGIADWQSPGRGGRAPSPPHRNPLPQQSCSPGFPEQLLSIPQAQPGLSHQKSHGYQRTASRKITKQPSLSTSTVSPCISGCLIPDYACSDPASGLLLSILGSPWSKTSTCSLLQQRQRRAEELLEMPGGTGQRPKNSINPGIRKNPPHFQAVCSC